MRLNSILDKVGDNCEPERLKTIVGPLIARSESDQRKFYRAFDDYLGFALGKITEDVDHTDDGSAKGGRRRN